MSNTNLVCAYQKFILLSDRIIFQQRVNNIEYLLHYRILS